MSAVGFQSDSHLLVDRCLAQLRIEARLDDDPILPTIDVLPSADLEDDDDFLEVDESELVIECAEVKDLPSAASIVRASIKANQSERSQKDVPTLRTMRAAAAAAAAATAPARHARWPLLICALVAMYCGMTAFLRSPLGAKPEVQHVVKVSRGHIAHAIESTRSLVRL